jgi:hypothetical protein
MQTFEEAHKLWLDGHLGRRRGERKRRLKSGHAHGEQEMLRRIWWPIFHNFDFLHPEYEVVDFHEGKRFIDLAYIRPPFRIAFEVLGYGPHQRDVSRRDYCDHWVRHSHLVNDGWLVIYIGYDDLKDRPRLWQQMVLQLVGKFFGNSTVMEKDLTSEERDIIRLAVRVGRPIKIADIRLNQSCAYRKARAIIRRLEEKRWLTPHSKGNERIHTWRLSADNKQLPM